MLAFLISVCSAYQVPETCFLINNISSHLYSGAEPHSAENHYLNIGADDVSFVYLFIFILSLFLKQRGMHRGHVSHKMEENLGK